MFICQSCSEFRFVTSMWWCTIPPLLNMSHVFNMCHVNWPHHVPICSLSSTCLPLPPHHFSSPLFISIFYLSLLPLSLSPPSFPRLLAPQNEIVKDLEQLYPCELVLGMNGRLWVRAATVQKTLIVASLLESSENMTAQQRRSLFKRVADGNL